MRVATQATSQFGLDTSKRIIELFGGRGTTLDLVQSLVEHLGDVKQTDDVALFVANGLKARPCQLVYRTAELDLD